MGRLRPISQYPAALEKSTSNTPLQLDNGYFGSITEPSFNGSSSWASSVKVPGDSHVKLFISVTGFAASISSSAPVQVISAGVVVLDT